MIEKTEQKYILYAGITAFLYFGFLMTYLNKTVGDNPYLRFLIFNLGIYLAFFIFLKSFSNGAKTNLMISFGLILLFLAGDNWTPEYHVTMSGELVAGGILSESTTDYLIGLIGLSLGIKGILLYMWTYVLVPLTLLYLSSKILPNAIRLL